MAGDHQNLNSSRDLTLPLSGILCHPWAGTCYDQPIYQIWSLSTHYEDIQGSTKYHKLDGLG